MNNLKTQSVEELIINSFEKKVANIAAEKIQAILDDTSKLIYDQISEMFDENQADEAENAFEQICFSVNHRILSKFL